VKQIMRLGSMAGALLLALVSVAGCVPSASPTPEPKETPVPTDTPVPTETSRPLPSTTPEPTAVPVPVDPDAFAEFVIEEFGTIEGVDLGITGYVWVNERFISLETDDYELMNKLFEVDRDAKDRWAKRVAAAMNAYTGGADEWLFWLGRRYIETNAARAGERSVTMKEWVSVSDDYDSEAGGFPITEYPVRISKYEHQRTIKLMIFADNRDIFP